jgi:hypothetical protein
MLGRGLKEDKKMKKIEYNFFCEDKPMTKMAWENEVWKNWKRHCVRDKWGIWHYGIYEARPAEKNETDL